MFETVAESMHELFGLVGSYVPAGGDSVAVTIRPQAGQAAESAIRQGRRERTTAILYLRSSEVATRPTRSGTITVTDEDSTWAGVWTLTADAEPTPNGEWRCLCLSERTSHTIAAGAGAPRPPE
jgi:hypothetical protein